MGHATAEAVVRAGLQLVPFSFTGASEGVAVGNIGICGIPVELVGPEKRQEAMDRIKADFPGLVLIDYTLPSVVNGGDRCWYACQCRPLQTPAAFVRKHSPDHCNCS